MIIAIDGPAGAGKSTIAKRISEKTGFFYLNSGNFYRGITLKIIEKGIPLSNPDAVINLAKSLDFTVSNGRLCINNIDVEDLLHTAEVDALVSPLSGIIPIRRLVNENFQKLGKDIDLVAEGRDMTTVVFPHAEFKFYMDASVDIRAQRRYDQGSSTQGYEEIKQNIIDRDENDRNKKEGSLKISEDAIYMDTSDLTIDEVCEKVLSKISYRDKSRSN